MAAARNQPGGIGDLVLLGNGAIMLRNADSIIATRPNIYEAFGPYGSGGQTKATADSVVMPNAGVPPTSGAFPLTFAIDTTGSLAYNSSASAIASALNALATVTAAGGVTVTGPAGGPWVVTFNVNGAQSLFQSGANTFGAVGNAIGVVIIAMTQAGTASLPTIQTITPALVSAQAAALLINAAGYVDPRSFGTFISPLALSSAMLAMLSLSGVPQYATLATDMAAVEISSDPCVLCAGQFQSYYLKGVAVTADQLALIDLTTFGIRAGFSGGALAFLSTLASEAVAPRVFSDGGSNFGIYSPGSGFGNARDTLPPQIWTYTYSFGAVWPPSGAGTFVSITISGQPTFSSPIASYRGTGFNGPILIGTGGAIAGSFSIARFSIARPVPLGGVFVHDSILSQPSTDVPTGNISSTVSWSSGTATITLVGSNGTTYYLIGGSAYGWASGNFNGGNEVASIQNLFPDCSVSLISSGNVSGTRTTVVTVTMPANATYAVGFAACSSGSLAQTPPLICISTSDGVTNDYYPAPFALVGGVINAATLLSTALAVQGSTICHVTSFTPPANGNANWTIVLPGIGRINVSVNAAFGTTNKGTNLNPINGFAAQPVSVVPFNGGFAIAWPHDPTGNAGTPYEYAFTPAKVGAATTLLKCPIILIDASGNPNTAFDANLYTNFFSLAQTDRVRYGPLSLMVKGSDLYFGSFYIPSFINPAQGSEQIDGLGGITNPPVWSPFGAPGAYLEVLCACDTSGNRVLPPNHP